MTNLAENIAHYVPSSAQRTRLLLPQREVLPALRVSMRSVRTVEGEGNCAGRTQA